MKFSSQAAYRVLIGDFVCLLILTSLKSTQILVGRMALVICLPQTVAQPQPHSIHFRHPNRCYCLSIDSCFIQINSYTHRQDHFSYRPQSRLPAFADDYSFGHFTFAFLCHFLCFLCHLVCPLSCDLVCDSAYVFLCDFSCDLACLLPCVFLCDLGCLFSCDRVYVFLCDFLCHLVCIFLCNFLSDSDSIASVTNLDIDMAVISLCISRGWVSFRMYGE